MRSRPKALQARQRRDHGRAGGAGVEGIGDCVDAEMYTAWVQASNDSALAGIEGADIPAIQGTPTLVVNGTTYRGSVEDGDAIIAFITSGGES